VDKLLTRRINTTIRTSNSGTFTAETVTDTVTGTLTSTRLYTVCAWFLSQSSVAADSATPRIREDNVSGTQIQATRIQYPIASVGFMTFLYGEYTAVSSGSKSFVLTGIRASGTGNISFIASAGNPTYFWIEHNRN